MLNFCDFIQVFVFTTNHHLNPIALRKAKIVCSFGLFHCNRVKVNGQSVEVHPKFFCHFFKGKQLL